ncbi:MAG TPA: DUF4215 domain-containing protein [Polyangiaceae bacterium]|nr:DUF4215 domain-containing protein [Polyangiaceae bacterium]
MVWGRAITGMAAVLLVACGTSPRSFVRGSGGEGGVEPRGGAPAASSGAPAASSGAGPRGGSAYGGSGGEAGDDKPPIQGDGGSSGAAPEGCGDTLEDPKNCGSCGHECSADHVCNQGSCQPTPDHCKDDKKSEDETDLNCGGSCGPCAVDAACAMSADCESKFCNAQLKCAVPRCTDAVHNGVETGLDCGGEICRALNLLCNNGENCAANGDCKTGYCSGGVCASPSCSDSVLNQGETAVDCGGPVCRLNVSPLGTCANGQACTVNEDCTSMFCNNLVCAKPSCTDNVKNQDETGKDCGGPTCRGQANGKCPEAEGCLAHADCNSGFCSPGKLCAPAGCGNNAKDPNETDLDCGGEGCRATKPCALTQSCVIHADCASGSCQSSKCVAATCQDGIKNQGETAVDCGGATCSAAGVKCANGQACEKNGDCTDGFCLNNVCSGACKGKPPTLGCPCTPDSSLACAGTAQAVKLICTAGSWATNGTSCPQGYNCSGGECKAVIAACASAGASKTYCEAATPSTQSFLCDADLVSSTGTQCAGSGVCKNGACQAAACGDGRTQSGEQCDDGNTTPLDGCENDCKTSRVLSLALGNGFTCALTQGGYVRCWGANGSNELGLGDTDYRQTQEPYKLTKPASSTTPAGPIDLGGSATAITAGVGHTCALLTDGTARCWGDNTYGQLGLGNVTAQVKTPKAIGAVKVASGRKIVSISAGARHTCAVLDDASATCWGQNDVGQLGLGNTTAVSETQTPAQIGAVSLGANVISLGSGASYSCALLAGGKVRCWGSGNLGRMGTSTTANVGDNETPSSLGDAGLVPTVSGVNVVDLKVGVSHACVLLSNDKLECWGQNTTGAIGIGSTVNIGDNESPATFGGTVLATADHVQSLSVGTGSTCAVFTGSTLRCWGLNTNGQAGYNHVTNLGIDNTNTPSLLAAVSVGSGRTVKSVYAGASDTCVILDNDSVKCWGLNDTGQLGFGTVSTSPSYIGGAAGKTPDTLAAIRILAQ